MKNLTSSVTLILSVVLLLALGSLVLTNSSSAQKSKTVSQQTEAAGTTVVESFNQFLAIQVANNGRFNMGAFPNSSGGAGANSYDLTYRWPEAPDTSYSTIRIDGTDNIYGSSGTVIETPRDIDAKTNRSKWKVGDIEITQILQLVLNPQTGREDLGKISYIVKNVGSASHSVGQRIMLDTEIARNDGVPFRVPGVGIVRNEMEFVGSAIPDTFLAFFDVTRSDRVSTSILKSNVEVVPDRLVLASWGRIFGARFDYTINPNLNFTGDSAYAVYWNARTLAAGESRTYTTYYGLAKLDTDLQPPLALSVDGPAILSVVNNQYSPNPFDVVATVFNNGTAAATNVQLTLNLPSGLSLVSGNATQSLGNLGVGQERQISWRAQAASQSNQITLRYSVSASAANAQTKNVERSITLPAINTLSEIEVIDPTCPNVAIPNGTCPGTFLVDGPRGVSLTSNLDSLAKASIKRDGAATDGVTLLLLRVHSETPVTFALKKDGVLAGSEWGRLSAREAGAAVNNSVTIAPESTPTNGKIAFAIFHTPIDFPEDSPISESSVILEATTDSGRVSKTIILRRPPVVLVHGVWSDNNAWVGLRDYLQERGFSICDGCLIDYGRVQPAGSFDPFATDTNDQFVILQLALGTRYALNSYRRQDLQQRSFAVTQVDVVGHSMGGLVARARVKFRNTNYPYYTKGNYNLGDFHKIITVGTPHQGSPLADWLIAHKCDEMMFFRKDVGNIEEVFTKIGRPIGPAIYGFQTSSDAIRNIGATPVPSHAIVGVAPNSSATENWLNRIPNQSGNSSVTIDNLLGNNGNHDTIVPVASQRGGMSGDAITQFAGIVHADIEVESITGRGQPDDVGETASQDVWRRVTELLQGKVRSSTFSIFPRHIPPGTPTQPYDCPSNLSIFAQATTAATVTLMPSPRTVVHPGDTLQINFAINGGNAVEGALFMVGDRLHFMEGAGPFSFSFRVPSTKAGRFDIRAETFGPGAANYGASTYVLIEPASPPLTINVTPTILEFEKIGEKYQLHVTGQLSGGIGIDLTSSTAGTRYSVQSGSNAVITISHEGLVEARGAGREVVAITNSGKITSILVDVRLDNPIPSIDRLTPNSILAGSSEFTLVINGENFTNDTVAYLNSVPRQTTFVSSQQLTVQIPASDIIAAGTSSLNVFTPGPGGGGSNTLSFTIFTGYEADVSPRPNGNGDGTATMADWVQLGRFYIGLDTIMPGSEFQRADCFPKDTKGDGKITIGDWVQAGRYAAGLDPVVPVGGPTTYLATLPSFAAKFPLSLEAQARNIRIRNANFLRGQIGTIQIELEAQGNENAAAFSLNYDPRLLTFVDAKAGSDVNGAVLQINRTQAASGRLGFALVLAPGQQLAAGMRTLVSLRFIPSGNDGVIATNISFSDQLLAREVVDQFATPITAVNYTSGTITISGRAAANVSAASYADAELAADSIASAFGTNLATLTTSAISSPLPMTLGGTSVKIKDAAGVERNAPLFFVSPNQINYQIPAGTADGIASVTITNGLGEVISGLLNISKVAPGLFAADASGKGWAAAEVVSVASDGSQTLSPVARFDVAQNKYVAVPIDLTANATVLVLYGTGIRQNRDLSSVNVKVGSTVVAVEYAGPQPNYVGLDQINVRLPKNLTGRGIVSVEVRVNGKAANTLQIAIR